ncbi:anthranilate phosphoribosyltransferase [Longispora albida]|uniref:anthranilate phosphoribosyltransferase n=1 Tax=Longispora albida TaxID=203523 RepID=UPI0003657693|nr:anthranilate phosphoribosyltransferase [Longispora albida]
MGDRTWPHLLSALISGTELTSEDTAWAMGEIMSGEATGAQVAGFAIALRAKGETAAEMAGLVESMLGNATRVPGGRDACDIVGTGGDRAHTVNISTMGALVVAGAGVRVVKHGNRAASSSCGSADLLEYLGIPLDLGPAGVQRCLEEAGIGFCFAPRYHPGMRHAAPPRRELGVPTAFNFLGPLTNPAQPRAATVGCADLRMAPVLAEVFARRGDSVLLVRGEDGLDEFTTAAATRVWVVTGGTVTELLLDAADFGLPRAEPDALRGADVTFNADVAHRVLAGERGPVRDAVLVNAACAIAAYEGLQDVSGAIQRGLDRAAQAIDSGSAAALLTRWVEVAQAARAAE